MRQTTISAHFPSIKSDFETTTRKRKHKETDDDSLHISKIIKLDLSQHNPRICKSLNDDFVMATIEPLQAQKLKTLLTVPSQVPNLSEKTQKVIEDLKKRSYDRPRKEVDDVLTSVTAKEKYQDLLDPQRALALPYNYRRLLDLLEASDSCLNYENRKKNQISFENLKRAVSETHKLKFDISQLQQITYVIPNIYKLSWVKKSAKEYELLIDFPENLGKTDNQITRDQIEVRKAQFRKNLIEITKKHHEDFLRSLPSRPHIDPEKLKTWHSSFDLHNLQNIPFQSLPEKPDQNYISNISEIHEMGTARNLLIKSVFEGISENKPINIAEEAPKQTFSVIKGLSSELSAKIKAKEAALIEAKLQAENPEILAKNAKIERLISMCELLKILFSMHKTPSIFFSCLIKKASKAYKKNNKENIEEDVKEIIEMFPSWLSIFNTNSGDVVRMNRKQEMPMSEILQEIHHKYN